MVTETVSQDHEYNMETAFIRRFIDNVLPFELTLESQRERLENLQRVIGQWLITEERIKHFPSGLYGELIRHLLACRHNVCYCTLKDFLGYYKSYILPRLFPENTFRYSLACQQSRIDRYLRNGSTISNKPGEFSRSDAEYILLLLRLGNYMPEAEKLNQALKKRVCKSPSAYSTLNGSPNT